jgi:hypothetical protein
MNEQLPIVLPTTTPALADRAQRIRDLVGVARTCIIEIGRELIAAKADLAHGQWLPWLDAEFGWSDNTAHRYMQVARAFQIPHSGEFGELTIDATALYALSAPDVPQAVRDEALSRAEDGERITKTEADQMVADARQAAIAEAIAAEREAMAIALEAKDREAAELRTQIEQIQQEAANATDAELKDAAKTLNDLQTEYDAVLEERDAVRNELDHPSEDQIIRLVGILSKHKPGRLMLIALASALGRTITYAGKQYDPAGEAALVEMRTKKAVADEKLKQLFDPKGPPAHWHKALMALRTLNALEPVKTLMERRYDGFDHAFANELPKAERWITEFAKGMQDVGQPRGPANRRSADQGQTETRRGRRLQHV